MKIKKLLVFTTLLAALVFTACSSDTKDDEKDTQTDNKPTTSAIDDTNVGGITEEITTTAPTEEVTTTTEPLPLMPDDTVIDWGDPNLETAMREKLEGNAQEEEVAEEVIRPSKEECIRNPRAKSTKMRWAIKA